MFLRGKEERRTGRGGNEGRSVKAKPERRKKQTLMKAIPHIAAAAASKTDGNKDYKAGEEMGKKTENLQRSLMLANFCCC